jgi:hypothetical protein
MSGHAPPIWGGWKQRGPSVGPALLPVALTDTPGGRANRNSSRGVGRVGARALGPGEAELPLLGSYNVGSAS